MAIASTWKRLTLLFVAALFGGCGLVVDVDPPDPQLDGGARSDFGALDAGARDAAMFEDANVDDASSVLDATGIDATSGDAAMVDATLTDATAPDASALDGGAPVDLGVDAGTCINDGDCLGDFCNSDGHCSAGVCVYSSTVTCSPPFVPDCTMRVCDPTARGCIAVAAPGACNDDILCTNDVCDVVSGLCSHIPNSTVCSDRRDCTIDTCEPANGCADPLTGCVAAPRDELCLVPGIEDPCAPRVCVGETVAATSGCAVAPTCTLGICNTAGLCVTTPRADVCTRDSQCDDGNPCNGSETCAGMGTGRRCALGTTTCPRGPCIYDPALPAEFICLPDVVCSP